MPYIGKQPATISAVSVDTDTGTFSGQVAAASLDISGNVDVDGVLETDGLSIASTVITASAADINLIDGITNGTVIASKAIITDANKDISGGRNITISGELDAATLDISGNADIDGTLEADAITVNGTALNTVIAGVTVANATLAATATVTDSNANTNFPIVFHDESNALLDDTGALRYNPSTGELLVPKLTVAGVTTTADTVTMQAANAVVFEGATADAHETTLTITDPTADRTITLPNVSGTLPILAADSNTAITSTPAELNILDGVTSTTAEINLLDGSVANTVVNSKAVIYGSSGELAGALSTAAQPNVTSLGTLTALTVDDITINGSTISDGGDLTVDVGGDFTLDVGGGDIAIKDDGTEFGRMVNSSSDFVIQSSANDKDLIFKGKDNNSVITALTLDMSDAGTALFNHDIKLTDNSIALFGTGNDLQIYHDGNDSNIADVGTGTLLLKTDGAGIYLQKGSSETLAQFKTDAEVNLYHDNSKRLETTANGIKITGSAASDTALEITAGDLVYSGASNFDIKHTNDAENITFSATPSGGSTTQYMRLESDGRLKLGTSETISLGLLNILFDGTNLNAIGIKTSRSATGSNFAVFVNSSNGVAGLINHNGSTSVNYSTSSDYRLKENVNYSFDATTRLKQLKPCRFNFIEDGTDKVVDGFLAHEVSSIVPEAITGEKDAVDDNNDPIIQQIDQSKLIPLLTKTLQEQQATIEALTARIVTLEGA